MAVLDEDNLKHGSMQATTKPPMHIIPKLSASTAGASTSLEPGPMELGAIAGSSKSDQCARCKGYGHWSPACGTPHNWRHGDPIAGRVPGGRGPGSRRGETGRPWVGSSKGQAHNTEADEEQAEGKDEDQDLDEESEVVDEEEQGKE